MSVKRTGRKEQGKEEKKEGGREGGKEERTTYLLEEDLLGSAAGQRHAHHVHDLLPVRRGG